MLYTELYAILRFIRYTLFHTLYTDSYVKIWVYNNILGYLFFNTCKHLVLKIKQKIKQKMLKYACIYNISNVSPPNKASWSQLKPVRTSYDLGHRLDRLKFLKEKCLKSANKQNKKKQVVKLKIHRSSHNQDKKLVNTIITKTN